MRRTRRATIGTAAILVIGIGALALPGGASELQTVDTSAPAFLSGVANQGWWSDKAANTGTNSNYLVGTVAKTVRRDFFSFDLSGVSAPILSAHLEVSRGRSAGVEATETVELFDVTTDAAALNERSGPSPTIFADLGSGVSYGRVTFGTAGAETDVISLPLEPAGVAALNAARGGWFSVGGALVSDDGNDSLFLLSQNRGAQRLVLEVDPWIEVGVDVKPGSDDNPVNVQSGGVLPVAVLSGDGFDATRLLPSTLRVGPGGATPHLGLDIVDVDDDGDDDVVVHVRSADVGLDDDSTEVCLTGETLDSARIRGCDAVRIVGQSAGQSKK